MHHIYYLQNNTNLKVYVGYSTNPQRRWAAEHSAAMNPKDTEYDSPLSRAIRRDGWENFTKTIVESFECKKEALEAEQFHIEFMRSNRRVFGTEYGYNLHEGGNLPPNHKGVKKTAEHKAKIAASNTGKVRSAEARKKMSDAHIGKPSNRLGKKHSEESRAKMSASLKGREVWNKGTSKKVKPEPRLVIAEEMKVAIRSEYEPGRAGNWKELKSKYGISTTSLYRILEKS
jgi:group I intron endonuclease